MPLRSCYPAGDADGRPGYRIAFDYDAELVEALKAAVPHTEREWHPKPVLEWWISEQYEPELRRLFPDFETYANQPRLL